jgi:hypothetical protein
MLYVKFSGGRQFSASNQRDNCEVRAKWMVDILKQHY